MKEPQHFVEPGWHGGHYSRLSNETYGVVRDNVVIACADVILIDPSERILLVPRAIHPLQGQYWVIGGKILPGLSPVQAAQQHLQRDTQLELTTERFIYVGTYSTVFAMRNELPCEHGTHTINITYAVKLTLEEVKTISLNQVEYQSTWRTLTISEIKKEVETGNLYLSLGTTIEDLECHLSHGQPTSSS